MFIRLASLVCAACLCAAPVSARSPERASLGFAITWDVGFGSNVYVVGSHPPDLGAWSPTGAVKLRWTAGNVWTGQVAVRRHDVGVQIYHPRWCGRAGLGPSVTWYGRPAPIARRSWRKPPRRPTRARRCSTTPVGPARPWWWCPAPTPPQCPCSPWGWGARRAKCSIARTGWARRGRGWSSWSAAGWAGRNLLGQSARHQLEPQLLHLARCLPAATGSCSPTGRPLRSRRPAW